jgi:hypothetical protein
MSGAIHPLPQYAFMAWCLVKSTGTTLPLPLPLPILNEYDFFWYKNGGYTGHFACLRSSALSSDDTLSPPRSTY